MKKLMALIIAAIVGNTMFPAVASAQAGQIYLVDSCWWQLKTDSIKIDYLLIADSSGLIRKQKADLLVRRYEVEQCKYRWVGNRSLRNDVYLLNGVPVDVIHFRRKDGWSSWQ